jgi:carboxyl-terminal processing protease
MTMRKIVLVAVGLVLGAAAAGAQEPKPQAPTRVRTLSEDLLLFSQVLNQIRVNHPDSMDSHAMLMAAIEGLVGAADPHSFVIPAVRLDSSRQRALEQGKLAPVPITFVYLAGVPSVVSVAPSSNASRQDILVGDALIAIEGQPVVAESSEELDVTLAGTKGSSVTLRFSRLRLDGSATIVERVVKRERPEETTAVPVEQMLDSTTGYVRVTTFANARVADDVHDAIGRLEKSGMRRLIMDLRDNGGGLVSEAGNVAGEFLPKNAVIYTTEGRKESIRKTVKVSRSFWRRERSYPLVVMVNRGTASASELVAGALQDHDRALIVGRPTFGKALLMQGMPLTDGSLMMLVIGHVRTPCGRVIQRQYRGVRQSDYYRGAAAERDTAGRPSCRTTAGRTVYGGGGIYPDVVFDHATPTPVWLTDLREQELLLKWAGAAISDPSHAPDKIEPYLAGRVVSPAVLAEFRTFARANDAEVPDGADVDARLRRELSAALARARLGESAYYRVLLRDDPWIEQSIGAFGRAALLRGPTEP